MALDDLIARYMANAEYPSRFSKLTVHEVPEETSAPVFKSGLLDLSKQFSRSIIQTHDKSGLKFAWTFESPGVVPMNRPAFLMCWHYGWSIFVAKGILASELLELGESDNCWVENHVSKLLCPNSKTVVWPHWPRKS